MHKTINVVLILFIGFLIINFYTFLHEGGHALMAWGFGAKVTTFDISILGNPHVKYSGDLTDLQRAAISLAGPLLPLLAWFVFMLFVNKKRDLFFQKVAFIVSGAMVGSLVPNIFIPVIHEFGGNTARQDMGKFLTHTGLNGFEVSMVVTVIFALSIWLIVSKIKVLPALKYQLSFTAKNLERN